MRQLPAPGSRSGASSQDARPIAGAEQPLPPRRSKGSAAAIPCRDCAIFGASVIIECTSCHARYQYDEARFEQKASKKIKCAKCATVFEIFSPTVAPPAPPAEAAAPAPVDAPAPARPKLRGAALDQTQAARPKPQTVTQPEEPPEERPTAETTAALQMPDGKRLSLAIIDGPGAGSVFRIVTPRITIGRDADFVIEDDEASREHAAIEIRDTIYVVRDLDSKNGTVVNGVRIEDVTELQDKSEFVIGGTTIMLIVTQEV